MNFEVLAKRAKINISTKILKKGACPCSSMQFQQEISCIKTETADSSGIHGNLMDFRARFEPKNIFLGNVLAQKIIFWGKFLVKIFEGTPISYGSGNVDGI